MSTVKTRKPVYNTRWINWSKVTTAQPRKQVAPRDEAELIELIQRAAASGETAGGTSAGGAAGSAGMA